MAEEQLAFLKFLPTASREQLLFILKNITSHQLNAIGEVCYNIQYGATDVSKLERFRNIIRILGDKKVSFKERKTLAASHPGVVVKLVQVLLP